MGLRLDDNSEFTGSGPSRDSPGSIQLYRGGAAYLYLISILIWPHFDTYPYISIQNILMSTQNILITKIYL